MFPQTASSGERLPEYVTGSSVERTAEATGATDGEPPPVASGSGGDRETNAAGEGPDTWAAVVGAVRAWVEPGGGSVPPRRLAARFRRELPGLSVDLNRSGASGPNLIVDGDVGIALLDRYQMHNGGANLARLAAGVDRLVVCPNGLHSGQRSDWEYLKRYYSASRLGLTDLAFVGTVPGPADR